jgi:Zn-dependent protease
MLFIETLIYQPILFIRVVAILIISICLHELAHGYVAISQGDDTPRRTGHITLNPVVHMGWRSIIFLCVVGITWGKMPINPSKFRHPGWSDIMVAAAGPMSNFILGFLCLAIVKVVDINHLFGLISQSFFVLAASINFKLCLFNLLPLPPLDGFYVYSEIFPKLQRLEGSQFSFFTLMLVFLIPWFGYGLNIAVNFIMVLLNSLLSIII